MENMTESTDGTVWLDCANMGGVKVKEEFMQDALDELTGKLAENPELFCNLNISDCRFKNASQIFKLCVNCSYFQKIPIPLIMKEGK